MNQDKFSKLQADHDEDLRRAQTRHALMSAVTGALDRRVPAPVTIHDCGYCADASLTFQCEGENALPELLKAYPAEPVVLVHDGCLAQKPADYLREQEQLASVLPLAPLLLKKESNDRLFITWWTRLRTGHMAQVRVQPGSMKLFMEQVSAPRYALDSHTYSTGSTTFGRRVLMQAPSRPMAEKGWLDRWEQFFKDEQFNGAQRRFALALKSAIDDTHGTGLDWQAAGLPEPNYDMAGKALAIPPDRDMLEYLDELHQKAAQRNDHWLDRVGDFWRYFDTGQAQRLWNFCLEQATQRKYLLAEDHADAQMLAGALERLLANGMPSDHPQTWRYVLHWVEWETGVVPSFRVANRHANGELELEFNNRHRLVVKANVTKTLRPQDIPVQYVD